MGILSYNGRGVIIRNGIVYASGGKKVVYNSTTNTVSDVQITYSFDNAIAGNAEGDIVLLANTDNGAGDYDIMWGNADGIMTNYSAINSTSIELTKSVSVTYSHMCDVNAIPKYATKVLAVKDGNIKASYDIPTSKLWAAGNYGEHLYSVELLSDVHYQYESGSDDWSRAFTFGRDRESVSAICIAGDLTDTGTTTKLNEWKTARDSVRGTTPVYSCNGNHEVYADTNLMVTSPQDLLPYLDSDTSLSGNPYFYKVINNDVYVFVSIFEGVKGKTSTKMFADATLTWLENVLETYRNQRVFLFAHIPPYWTATDSNGFGNGNGAYSYDLWGVPSTSSTYKDRKSFMTLLSHYKNVIWFSGHSHIKYMYQENYNNLNYMRWDTDGARLIHLSSLTVPRDIIDGTTSDYIYAESEGSIMDVYTDCVIIRGRNFVDDKYLGIASYLLDTTPVTIAAKPVDDTPEPTPATLSSISATKTKTTYNYGETVDTDDFTVTAHYSDGTTTVVDQSDCSFDWSQYDLTQRLIFDVGISYTENSVTKSTSITITVVQNSSEEPEPTVNPTIVIDATFNGSISAIGGYSDGSSVSVNDGKGTKKTASSGTKGYVTYDATSIVGKPLYYRIVGDAIGLDETDKVGIVVTKYSTSGVSGTFAKPDYANTSTEWTKLLNEDGTDFVADSSLHYLNVYGRASSASTATFPHTISARIQIGYVA